MKLCDFCKTPKKLIDYNLSLSSIGEEECTNRILRIASEACSPCLKELKEEIANLINKMKAKIEVTTIKKVEKFERND